MINNNYQYDNIDQNKKIEYTISIESFETLEPTKSKYKSNQNNTRIETGTTSDTNSQSAGFIQQNLIKIWTYNIRTLETSQVQTEPFSIEKITKQNGRVCIGAPGNAGRAQISALKSKRCIEAWHRSKFRHRVHRTRRRSPPSSANCRRKGLETFPHVPGMVYQKDRWPLRLGTVCYFKYLYAGFPPFMMILLEIGFVLIYWICGDLL